MTESRVGIGENQRQKVSRGCAFLSPADANILRLRAKTRKQTVSATIQELSQIAVNRYESSDVEGKNKIISGYLQQSMEMIGTGLEAFEKTSKPSFVEVYWVLPKEFVETLGYIAGRKISRESFLNGLLTDAINMRNE